MFCTNCGSQLSSNDKFCANCGAPVGQGGQGQAGAKNPVADAVSYVHESDRAALSALMAIPGFTAVLKAFMKVWNERQYRIQNMSGRIKIDENQLPEYYSMLPPICEKLGIAVPDLYLEANPCPNAYTSGDNSPFVVVTSGLLESFPHELIPTVLAHECGHIDCHHVLYSTMGRMIINGGLEFLSFFSGLTGLISVPLKVAFYYWMRCSEFSADRAAILCDGGYEKMARVCMALAGFNKNVPFEPNLDHFMEQAADYKSMIQNSKWDKTLEFLFLADSDHPLLAVRAFEARAWADTDHFRFLRERMPGVEAPEGELPPEAPTA